MYPGLVDLKPQKGQLPRDVGDCAVLRGRLHLPSFAEVPNKIGGRDKIGSQQENASWSQQLATPLQSIFSDHARHMCNGADRVDGVEGVG